MVFNILIGQTKSPEESSATSRETVNDEHVPCPDPPCGFDARQRFREKAVLNGTDPGGKQLIEGMQAEAQGALFGSAALKILRIPRALFKLAKFIKEARSSQITSKDIENVQKLISKAKMKKAFRYLNNLKLSNKDRKKVEVLHDKSKNSNLRFYEGLRSFDENNLSNNQVMDDLLKFLSKKKKKP